MAAVRRDDERKVVEIAEPFGVVAGIVPSTNPTSTAIYKILISLKARCPVVLSPHPSAARCITRVAEVMDQVEGERLEWEVDAFREMGVGGDPIPISAQNGTGLEEFYEALSYIRHAPEDDAT